MQENKKTEDKKRVNYTTTYNPDILNQFKEISAEVNVPSGVILESFMKSFINKELILTWDMINGYRIEPNKNDK